MTVGNHRTPPWVWAVILGLALIEPLTHFRIAYFSPDGTVPTGLHALDSAFYLDCMNMFESGFSTPYATCQSALGTSDIRFFSTAIYWMYGMVGAMGNALGVDDFLFLGLANGAGAAVYLFVVYRFLRVLVPRHANLAFLLYALGGGPAGVLYIATGLLGLHGTQGFEGYFLRFAMYEFFEGPYFLPVLHASRLYYTVALALCLGGFTAFINAVRKPSNHHLVFSCGLFLLGVFINMRFGVFVWIVLLLYLLCLRPANALRPFLAVTTSVLVAAIVSLLVIRLHPTFSANTFYTNRTAMWVSPFVSAALLHLVVGQGVIRENLRSLDGWGRVAAWSIAGYLGVFAVLFVGYQVYMGNLLVARDGAVAVWVSDKALSGAVVGFLFGLRAGSPKGEKSELGWIALWLILFVAGAISAFGGGLFLQLNPQRLMILIPLPLCVFSAVAIGRMAEIGGKKARATTVLFLTCGICSITVGAVEFQGPGNFGPKNGPYAGNHYEVMTADDGEVMERLEGGTVIAPLPYGDILATRPGVRVVYGVASVHGDQLVSTLQPQVKAFFSEAASDDSRKDFVAAWCVEFIFCGNTWPVEEDIVETLKGIGWLQVVHEKNGAVLFEVTTLGEGD